MKKIFVFSFQPEKSSNDFKQYEERHFETEFIFLDKQESFLSTLQNVIKRNHEEDYVIISTSQHHFSPYYADEYLQGCINKVKKLDGNVLLGGVLGFEKVIEVTDHIFWIDGFKGAQFFIIFNKTFPLFLQNNCNDQIPLDVFLSSNVEDVFLIHPFISVYKNDGNTYSFENTIDFQNLNENPEVLLKELSQIKKYYSYES